MTASQVWDLSDTVESTARFNVAMSADAKQSQTDRARRNANKMVSILGAVASLLALYDIALLARMGN